MIENTELSPRSPHTDMPQFDKNFFQEYNERKEIAGLGDAGSPHNCLNSKGSRVTASYAVFLILPIVKQEDIYYDLSQVYQD